MGETSSELRKDIRESADITVITQLILRERESRDLQRWETMRACFWPDSLVRVSWFRGNGPDFVTGSIDMAKRGIPAKHRLAPILVRLAGDRAVASLAGIIDLPVKLKGIEATLSAHSRFLYRAERRRGEWRIFGFDAIYIRDELTPAISSQQIVIDPGEIRDFRPSYRMLSYYLQSQRFTIDSELAGEDRPDLVDALYRELFDWAKLPIPT
jgi:SnoaL-like domain